MQRDYDKFVQKNLTFRPCYLRALLKTGWLLVEIGLVVQLLNVK